VEGRAGAGVRGGAAEGTSASAESEEWLGPSVLASHIRIKKPVMDGGAPAAPAALAAAAAPAALTAPWATDPTPILPRRVLVRASVWRK